MAKFRWIKTSLLLILVLQFTATLGQYTSFIVRDGDKVTLPCSDVTEDQDECNGITWSFGTKDLPEDLFLFGKTNENTKADRLSVTESCSLVIKKVTAEDAGQYICQHQSGTYQVHLSVVTMTEYRDTDEVTLTCSVSPYGECEHTVTWLNEDEDNKDMMTSPSDCSASVTTSLPESKHHEFFKCEVTEDFSGNTKQFIYLDSDEKTVTDGERVQVFPFRSQSSGEKPGEDTTTATTESATTTTTENNTTAACTAYWSALDYIMLVMRVAELLLITVITVHLFRAPGNQRPPDDNTVNCNANGQDVKVNYENVTVPSVSVRLP